MKYIVLILSVLLGQMSFANEDIATYIVAKNLVEKSSSFKLKSVLTNKEKFHGLVAQTLLAADLNSREDAIEMVNRAAQSLPLKSHIMGNPLYPELLYQVSQKPEAVSSIFQVFLQKAQLVKFFVFMVATMVLSHLLGELKFFMAMMSPARVGFSLFRFMTVNALRVGGFFYFFKTELAPIGNVYLASINEVSELYPLLFKLSHLLGNVLTTGLSF